MTVLHFGTDFDKLLENIKIDKTKKSIKLFDNYE